MPQGWSSQSSDDPDDFHTWLVRRNAQLALRSEADNVARNLWNQSIQNGDDLYAGNPSDLTALGLAALDERGSYPATAANDDGQGVDDDAFDPPSAVANAGLVQRGSGISAGRAGGSYLPTTSSNGSQHGSPMSQDQNPGPVPPLPGDANDPTVSELDVVGRPTTPIPHPGFFDSLNHSLIARAGAGGVGYLVGLPFGALRAGWHALQGVGDGLRFAESLASPEGRTKAWNEARAATHNALQYGRSVITNPSRLASDAASAGADAVHNLVPFTTPMASTVSGELGHEFGIGMNAGETATNVAGLFAAPEVAGGLNAARTFAATREANVAMRMAQGFDEPTARYLAKRYEGQGDHALIPRRQDSIVGIPTPWLKKARIPDWIMDSPLNVSKPRGLSQGDFYEHHYGVDPRFHGAKLPRDLNGGKGWSGKRLGAERYSGVGQVWARTPQIWKDAATLDVAGGGLRLLPTYDSETPQ